MNTKQIKAAIAQTRLELAPEIAAEAERLQRVSKANVKRVDAVRALAETKVGNGSASYVRGLPAQTLRTMKKLEGMLKRLDKLENDIAEGKTILAYEPKPENMATVTIDGVDTKIDANVYKSIRSFGGNRESDTVRRVDGASADCLFRGLEMAGITIGTEFSLYRPAAMNAITGKERPEESFTFRPITDDGTVIGYSVRTPFYSEPENAEELAYRMRVKAQELVNEGERNERTVNDEIAEDMAKRELQPA